MQNVSLLFSKKTTPLTRLAVLIIVCLLLLAGYYLALHVFNNSSLNNKHLAEIKDRLPYLEKQARENATDFAKQEEYAHSLYLVGDNEKAIEVYNKAIELNPSDPAAYTIIGNSYRAQKDFEKAITAYKKSIELDEKQIDPYVNLAHMYIYDLKQHEEGFTLLEKVSQLHSDNLDLLVMLGKTYQQNEMIEKAKESYNKVVKLDPNNTDALHALKNI